MPYIAPDIKDLLNHPALSWDTWAICKPLVRALWKRLAALKPRRALEFGSGTVVQAAYAARHDAEVVTLEHEAAYVAQTGARPLGLRETVDLRLGPEPRHGLLRDRRRR